MIKTRLLRKNLNKSTTKSRLSKKKKKKKIKQSYNKNQGCLEKKF